MKVYLEEKDIERKITTYHDGLGTQQGLYVYGKDKIEVLSLADYTKQVRKEVCEQIKAEFDTSGFNKIDASLYPPTEEAMWIGKGFNACKERLFNKLDQIQGENECQKN